MLSTHASSAALSGLAVCLGACGPASTAGEATLAMNSAPAGYDAAYSAFESQVAEHTTERGEYGSRFEAISPCYFRSAFEHHENAPSEETSDVALSMLDPASGYTTRRFPENGSTVTQIVFKAIEGERVPFRKTFDERDREFWSVVDTDPALKTAYCQDGRCTYESTTTIWGFSLQNASPETVSSATDAFANLIQLCADARGQSTPSE